MKKKIFAKIAYCGYALHVIKTRFWYALFLKKSGKKNTIINPILLTPSILTLGDCVFIRNNCRIEGVFEYQGMKYTPSINIASNVTIEQNLHLTCAKKITIGKNTAVAANVTITDIEHQYSDISKPPERQPLKITPVSIGEDCKIYNNAVLLPGTILGNHTIVAANAVVLGREYPSFCVLAGIPARIIKKYSQETSNWISI